MPPNSVESHELDIKIKESVSTSLLPYTNSFCSYKDSNTLAYWHSEINYLQYYLPLESGPTSCMLASPTQSEDSDVSSSVLDWLWISLTVHFVLSACILFFHSVYMFADSSLLFFCHISKILLCQLLYIWSSNVTFFAAVLPFTVLQIFSMRFKSG